METRDTVAGVLFVAICERAEPRDARAASDVTQRHGEVYYEKSLFFQERGSRTGEGACGCVRVER